MDYKNVFYVNFIVKMLLLRINEIAVCFLRGKIFLSGIKVRKSLRKKKFTQN